MEEPVGQGRHFLPRSTPPPDTPRPRTGQPGPPADIVNGFALGAGTSTSYFETGVEIIIGGVTALR
ncbi:hypothetical protein [Virgisporangium ochraceum]|uniref:hypothetical protein n=1 Tax=Virgisporangium ochraceum TaxID=65505 RepID=UPI001942B19C|nr:hypothetical protein [Virgisporangium ochraceum]